MKTSTQAIPEHHRIPRHIAVIMDGNGRWAKKRFMPRVMGHKKGLDALENLCAECSAAGVEYLTVRRGRLSDGSIFTGIAKTGQTDARTQYAPESDWRPQPF